MILLTNVSRYYGEYLMNKVIFFIFALLSFSGPRVCAAELMDECRKCHQDEKFRVQNKKLYDYFQDWNGSAHDLAGLSCSSCHGGDPAKNTMEGAHAGILVRSHPDSPFNYQNIPRTCGRCHPEILERFQKSRHYEQIKASGRGPTCITCHGSLDTHIYHTTIVERACTNCHNKKTGNHPEIPAKAREILGRLNHANGYRKGLRFYYKTIKKPEAMSPVDKAYGDIVRFWHEFDFEKLGPRTQELLAELKALYTAAHKDDHGEK
jgi:hypothetical protein